MPNLYATLDELKSLLDIEDAENDSSLMRILKAASRQIEKPKLTGRYFYCWEGTKYFDGGGSKLWLPADILSITTLKLDEDGDGTYEATLATTDYHLYPLNEYPKIKLEINSNGDYGGFASGILKGIEIAGVFGYGNGLSATPYESRTTLSAAITSTTATSVSVTSGATLKVGETIRVDSEQMFISDITSNTLMVERGVNGTTAATHSNEATVSAYLYPEDIVQATLIMAMRAYKRKDSAYQDVVGNAETGQIITSKGIDPDVAELVTPFRRQEYI